MVQYEWLCQLLVSSDLLCITCIILLFYIVYYIMYYIEPISWSREGTKSPISGERETATWDATLIRQTTRSDRTRNQHAQNRWVASRVKRSFSELILNIKHWIIIFYHVSFSQGWTGMIKSPCHRWRKQATGVGPVDFQQRNKFGIILSHCRTRGYVGKRFTTHFM